MNVTVNLGHIVSRIHVGWTMETYILTVTEFQSELLPVSKLKKSKRDKAFKHKMLLYNMK